MGIQIILVCVVGPGTVKIPESETNIDRSIESHKAEGEAEAGKGDMHQRTQRIDPRSRSATWSAHSIEQNSFQDHPDLHGRHPFECNDFVKKTFHTIS